MRGTAAPCVVAGVVSGLAGVVACGAIMARYIIVCRTGAGGARDDVVVDAVTAHCR